MYTRSPMCLSKTTLNASAVKGSFVEGFLKSNFPFSPTASIAGRSKGDGRHQFTASMSGWTPLFFSADPSITTTALLVSPPTVKRRKACLKASPETSFPSTNSSIMSSSSSPTASIKVSLSLSAFSFRSASWIPCSSKALSSVAARASDVMVRPSVSGSKKIACMSNKSTTPLKSLRAPMGIWITSGFVFNRDRRPCRVCSRSAPSLSILFTNAKRGTL
mmetsp:Transcript_41103/g.100836  ORF Transcript_41103/g.100836 Transcript_41103/m.100836 type:complete len:219 (+) Transcript_41103:2078-2734(+)